LPRIFADSMRRRATTSAGRCRRTNSRACWRAGTCGRGRPSKP